MQQKSPRYRSNVRNLRLETLESRELLSVTTAELGPVAQQSVMETAALPDETIALSAATLENGATTRVVDTLSDLFDLYDSQTTLREAIYCANAGDTIVFDASLAGGTITLVDGQLEITESITIDASNLYDTTNEVPGLTIDANRLSRVFHVTGGTSDAPVVVNGLEVVNGFISLEVGGAIYNEGSLNLAYCSFSNNESGCDGGAIYSDVNSTLNVSDSVFSENVSLYAGAIRLYRGTANLTNCTIQGNNESGFIEYQGVKYPTNDDIGIAVSSGTLDLTNCTIQENANFGIDSSESAVTARNCTIQGNHAGGVRQYEGTLELTDCTIQENVSGSWGGGVEQSGGTATLTNCTIKDNEAFEGGGYSIDGGTFGHGTVNLTNCTIEGNAAVGGGGIRVYNASVTATNCTIEGNAADQGGGIKSHGGALAVTNSVVKGNTAESQGGGIYCEFTDYSVTDCVIEENTAEAEGGGVAITVGGGQQTSWTNCTIKNNTSGANGGGIYENNIGISILTNCTISMNTSVGDGGGIYNASDEKQPSSIIATNCLITDNVSLTGDGGGLYNTNAPQEYRPYLSLTNCTVAANSSAGKGGGLYNAENVAIESYNTIIATNVSGDDSYPDLYLDVATPTGFNNLTSWDGWDGANNLSYDPEAPLFVDPDNGDYSLAENSQALNKGDNSFVAKTTDIVGNPRIQNKIVDLGAYELVFDGINLRTYNRGSRQAVMEWDPIPGAVKYIFKVSKDGGESWVTYDKNFTNTYKSVNGIYPGKSYPFRVYGVDANGNILEKYQERAVEPVGLVVTDKPYAANKAKNVTLQVADPSTVEVRWYNITDAGLVEIPSAFNQTSYVAPNGAYELKVIATGLEGTNSEGFSAEVSIARPNKTITFTDPNAAGTSATASWQTLPGAVSYTVKISHDGGKNWLNKKKGLTENSVRLNMLADGDQISVVSYGADGKARQSAIFGTFKVASSSASTIDDAFAELFADDELFVEL